MHVYQFFKVFAAVSMFGAYVLMDEVWVPFENYDYMFSTEQRNWMNAQMECEQHQSNLTSITSQLEQDFIISWLNTSHQYWIGLYTRIRSCGCVGASFIDRNKPCFNATPMTFHFDCCTCRRNWLWIDGLTSDYTNWYFDEPTGGQFYSRLFYRSNDATGWTWNDQVLSANNHFICKRSNLINLTLEDQTDPLFTDNMDITEDIDMIPYSTVFNGQFPEITSEKSSDRSNETAWPPTRIPNTTSELESRSDDTVTSIAGPAAPSDPGPGVAARSEDAQDCIPVFFYGLGAGILTYILVAGLCFILIVLGLRRRGYEVKMNKKPKAAHPSSRKSDAKRNERAKSDNSRRSDTLDGSGVQAPNDLLSLESDFDEVYSAYLSSETDIEDPRSRQTSVDYPHGIADDPHTYASIHDPRFQRQKNNPKMSLDYQQLNRPAPDAENETYSPINQRTVSTNQNSRSPEPNASSPGSAGLRPQTEAVVLTDGFDVYQALQANLTPVKANNEDYASLPTSKKKPSPGGSTRSKNEPKTTKDEDAFHSVQDVSSGKNDATKTKASRTKASKSTKKSTKDKL